MSKDAKKLAEDDTSESGTVAFEWRDLTFTVPRYKDWPIDALEALEDNRIYATLRSLLGPSQWAAFKRSEPAPTGEDVVAFSELLAQVASSVGSLGESEASSDS